MKLLGREVLRPELGVDAQRPEQGLGFHTHLRKAFAQRLSARGEDLVNKAGECWSGCAKTILPAHPHDTMHTWGDFMFGREKSFDRADAETHLGILQRLGTKPRVWVDHSMFIGNMIHFHRYGSMPRFTDASMLSKIVNCV